MLKCRFLVLSLACLATTAATHAAILRADKPYSDFAKLAGRDAFNAVAKIATGRGDYGSAVMLSEYVGITAASVLNNEGTATVTVGGETRTITQEDWVLRDGYRPSRTSPVNDLAIFRLTDPISSSLSFAEVYRGKKELSKGLKRMTYVGFESNRADGDGDSGGPIAFKNVFDGYGAKKIGRDFSFTDRDRLTIDFDDSLSDGSVLGRERPLKYEGVFERGEYGGAAFIKNQRGKWRLAGIGSATWGLFDDENNRVDTASFTRLSQSYEWISSYLYDESWTNPDLFGSYAAGGTLAPLSEEVAQSVAVYDSSLIPSESNVYSPISDLPAENTRIVTPEPSAGLLAVLASLLSVALTSRRRIIK